MASANLDLVRSICADWERGDFSSAEWAHSEIEFIVDDGLSRDTWTGLAGMSAAWRDRLSAWPDLRLGEVDEYRVLDGGRVLVLFRVAGHGKTSGIEMAQVNTKSACLFVVRDGKVATLVVYPSQRDRALADLGLARECDAVDLESGGSPG
jgi:hypothetical protein